MNNVAAKLLKLALRMSPVNRGAGQIVDCPFVARLLTGVRDTSVRNGALIKVDTDDHCGRRIYYTGAVDLWVENFCCEHVLPGDTVLDIGANFGSISLAAGKIVGATGSVHAFEPQPRIAQMLRESALQNRFAHVFVHELALTDRSGILEFGVPSNTNSGLASLDQKGGNILRVRAEHAGQFLKTLNLSRVRLLKIDAEGHEYIILSAAIDWLQTVRPELIVFENHGQTQVPRLLENCGYKIGVLHGYDWFGVRPGPT